MFRSIDIGCYMHQQKKWLVKELTKLKRSKGNLVKVRDRTAIGANTHVWIRK